jgi:glycosyltransferase involved in cell wall biosynthesis
MKFTRKSRSKNLLLVGVWVNRNWILGNWVREIQKRSKQNSHIMWVASVFAGKHFWENFVKFPLPEYGAYFFSYPSIFESYLASNDARVKGKSIVNYTHNLDELGSLEHQAHILNQAFSVHFNCSRDAESLIEFGLKPEKVRLVYGAIDESCRNYIETEKETNLIVLASRFGQRKGAELLPKIVNSLPEYSFCVLGRGWDEFINTSGLSIAPNFIYKNFDKLSRDHVMSRAEIFLSLSNLEGGPIPLIEAMSMGCLPIATDTGFARDFIQDGRNGYLVPRFPKADEVIEAIKNIGLLEISPSIAVRDLSWDRLAEIVIKDFESILKQ